MEITKTFWLGLYVLVGLYILYKLFFMRDPQQEEYNRVYNKILTSNKYKVKGQYDREE